MEYTEVIVKWGALLLVLFVIIFMIIPLFIIAEIASKKGRSTTLWILYSLIVSPLLSIFFLHVLGETDEKREGRIIEEEKLKNLYRNPISQNPENKLEKWLIENPGKTINDYYR